MPAKPIKDTDIHTYIHTYIHTDTQTYKHTDTQTDRHTHRHSQIIAQLKLRTILSRIRFFREKLSRPFFRRPYPLTLSKKSGKTNEAILHKAQPFLTKICRMRFFFENRAPSHFGLYHYASLSQKSEITNEPISRSS